jgi:hypothetical protein
MKAPDKIYIQTNKGEAFSSKWTTIPFRDFENTEYIRKDALLEWANSWLAFKRSGLALDDGFSYAMEELIKKINEM